MALIRLILDKHRLARKEFSNLFQVSEGFYVAVQMEKERLHLRSAPFARSSMLIKGPKYKRSMEIARQVLFRVKGSAEITVYTAYSPEDPSYFVSGFETYLPDGEPFESAEEKVLKLSEAWQQTLDRMGQENIEVWSK